MMKRTLLSFIFIAGCLSYPADARAAAIGDIEAELRAIQSYVMRLLNEREASPLTHDELRTQIENGAAWLRNAQEETGHFAYEYIPYNDEYRNDDNIVRQTGALYELGEIAKHDTAGEYDVGGTIERAASFFEMLSKNEAWEGREFRCITKDVESDRCALGATSLALTGILSYLKAYPESASDYDELIEDYLAYILASKKPGEGFRNVHRVGRSTQSPDESSFSNGEAMLALVRYYEYEPRDEVRSAIDDAFTYLKAQPFDTALYLWIMAALKDLNRIAPDPEYVKYGRDFTNWRVERTLRQRTTDNNYCAYAEGVASAYSLLESSLTTPEREKLRAELDFWNRKNSELQITDTDMYRVVNRDGSLELVSLPDMGQARGGFLTGEHALTQRIDFTQHCVSSYLQTLTDIEKEPLSL